MDDAGALGPWASYPALLTPFVNHGSAALGNHVYVVGSPSTCVGVAPLPAPRVNACVVATDSAVYVLGGDDGGSLFDNHSSVYVATPDASGNVGSWRTVSDLPTPKSLLGCAAF